jgi:hypothetical protein
MFVVILITLKGAKNPSKLLLLEQPINLSGGTIESTVSGFDVTGGESCYHEDALGQMQCLATSG